MSVGKKTLLFFFHSLGRLVTRMNQGGRYGEREGEREERVERRREKAQREAVIEAIQHW